jgi:hypothetical protein
MSEGGENEVWVGAAVGAARNEKGRGEEVEMREFVAFSRLREWRRGV